MAAVVARAALDLPALHDYLAAQLPEYARPAFLRIRQEIDVTTTFKQKKTDLVDQGYDPDATADPIYFNDPQRKAFVRLDTSLFKRINAGEVRL
jgi:fatty-acyl-CoA synthase